MVLPWPGESACTAPHANAARMSSSSAPLPAAASAKTPAKPSPERSVVVSSADRLGRRQRARARGHREGRGALGQRAGEHVLRVVAQAAGGVARGRRRAHRGPLARRGHDRLPAHAVGKRLVVDLHPVRVVHGCGQRQLHARERQAALARRRREPPLALHERDRAPVHGDVQRARDLRLLAREHRGAGEVALLEGGDLGLVEGVAEVDAVAGDPHRDQMVDGEVAQRVGAGGRRRHQQGQREAGDEERAPHRSAACARGAYRGEKRGLWASARRSHASASAVCPAARAAIPAW